MKKIIKTFLVILCGIFITEISVYASAGRGMRMFDQNVKTACGTNAFMVARSHTQEEWTKIYKANSLNAEIKTFCAEATPIKDMYQKDLYEFMYAMAKDSGAIIAG
ncbi:MAG: hypothetical protein PHR87_04795 [Sulfurospirillaceae bacterium]|nr:hypothetical protein [Sulfurospirillaceae bacterium]